MYTRSFVPPKNINLVQSEHNKLVDHDYKILYIRIDKNSCLIDEVKSEMTNVEIMLDLITNEIISIKIIK